MAAEADRPVRLAVIGAGLIGLNTLKVVTTAKDLVATGGAMDVV
jgi:hypothetical protein